MIDLGPPSLVFPKPAIIRPATRELLRYGDPTLANFLPGMFPGGVVMGAEEPLTIDFFGSASDAGASTGALTLPAGIQQYDLIVVADRKSNSSGTPGTGVPAGFTSIGNYLYISNLGREVFGYKIATGGETSIAYVSDHNLDSRRCVAVFRPSRPIATVTVVGFQSLVTDGNHAAQTVEASSGEAPLIVFGSYANHAGTAVSPRTMSPDKDGEVGNGDNFHWLAWKIYNASPADVFVDMDDEGTHNGLASWYLTIAE